MTEEYMKGFRDAQFMILEAYCKEHDVCTESQVNKIFKFIGLTTKEIKDFIIQSDNAKKVKLFNEVSKQVESQDELIYALWKKGFTPDDFDTYGINIDRIWDVVQSHCEE